MDHRSASASDAKPAGYVPRDVERVMNAELGREVHYAGAQNFQFPVGFPGGFQPGPPTFVAVSGFPGQGVVFTFQSPT
jgi:hypothetical protein